MRGEREFGVEDRRGLVVVRVSETSSGRPGSSELHLVCGGCDDDGSDDGCRGGDGGEAGDSGEGGDGCGDNCHTRRCPLSSVKINSP